MMKYVYPKSGYTVLRRHIEDFHPVFPVHIQQHISFLTGVSALPKIRKDLPEVTRIKKAGALDFNIPQTIRHMYNIPVGTKGNNTKNSQSVMEFLPIGTPSWSDLKKFSDEADGKKKFFFF